MSFKYYELEVIRWAEARGIIANSDAKSQLLKTMSELGELADAVIKRDEANIKDGFGDVLVTLIIAAELLDLDLTSCLSAAWEEIKDRKGYLNANGVFVKEQ